MLQESSQELEESQKWSLWRRSEGVFFEFNKEFLCPRIPISIYSHGTHGEGGVFAQHDCVEKRQRHLKYINKVFRVHADVHAVTSHVPCPSPPRTAAQEGASRWSRAGAHFRAASGGRVGCGSGLSILQGARDPARPCEILRGQEPFGEVTMRGQAS